MVAMLKTANSIPARFVFITHATSVGGAEIYLARVIRSLLERVRKVGEKRYSIDVVCRRDLALDAWCAALPGPEIRVHRLNFARPRDCWQLWWTLWGAQVAHLNLSFPFGKYQTFAALIARCVCQHVVITHHMPLDGNELGFGSLTCAIWRRVFTFYARPCQQHIAVAEEGVRTLVGRYHLDPKRVTCIYNGVDLDLFQPLDAHARNEAKRLMGREVAGEDWTERTPVVCSVGRLNELKGFRDLIEAAGRVVTYHPTMRLVIVGDGELRASLSAYIKRCGLSNHVYLVGSRSEMEVARYVGACDLYVMSSHFEGFGYALVEAMACGRPVVATAVGVAPEIVSRGAGILVQPRTINALAAAVLDMLDVLGDKERRSRMENQARGQVVGAYSMQRSLTRTLDVLLAYPDEVHMRRAP